MKVAANVIVALALLLSTVALVVSIYPGVLNDVLFIGILLSFLFAPVAAVITLIILIVLGYKGKLRKVSVPWTQVVVIAAVLFGSYVVLKFYIPRRIAFAVSRSAFEQMVSQATVSEYGGTPLNHRIGMYSVDEYAADPRGGVYFRVYRGRDGIGPDVMSYGFAYKPNREGTPFGSASYRYFRLGADWYWFRVSDDWY